MIRVENGRMQVSGALTLGNVSQVLEEGKRLLADGVTTVDLAEVSELDSSALALLLAWLREAKGRQKSLVFANLPESLQTIARLYGVQELLPVAA